MDARLPVTFDSLGDAILGLVNEGAVQVGVAIEKGAITHLCWRFPGGELEFQPVWLIEGGDGPNRN